MGRKAVTQKQLDQLRESFRREPPDGNPHAAYAAAAKLAGMDWRTAERAWSRGWREVRPLREELAEEQTVARAKLRVAAIAAEREAAPVLAQEDAAEQTPPR